MRELPCWENALVAPLAVAKCCRAGISPEAKESEERAKLHGIRQTEQFICFLEGKGEKKESQGREGSEKASEIAGRLMSSDIQSLQTQEMLSVSGIGAVN